MTESADLKFHLHDQKGSEDAKEILRALVAFNDRFHKDDWRELTITVRDESGALVAGLNGFTDWGWLFVNLLWVADSRRRSGLGSELLNRAEAEARARGCHAAWLDTFSFQAPEFYPRHGYREFGRLEDFPRGHSRRFLFKEL